MMDRKKIKICNASDVPPGQSAIVFCDEMNQEIALFNQGGTIYALNNLCPHMGGPLGEGEVEDGVVTCPWHGWAFCLKTGKCINVEGYEAEKIEIIVENNQVFMIAP